MIGLTTIHPSIRQIAIDTPRLSMNEKVWWYLARSSGIVAIALLVFSVVWGVLLATRMLRNDRPAWLLDMHKWLAGTALVMTALHLVGLSLDGYINFGFRDILVPGASSYRPFAVALGIVALYLMIAVQATSYMRKRLPKRVWRGIHLFSYLALFGAAIHAGLAGTDVGQPLYQALAMALIVFAAIAILLRVTGPGRGRAQAR